MTKQCIKILIKENSMNESVLPYLLSSIFYLRVPKPFIHLKSGFFSVFPLHRYPAPG